MDRIEEKKKFLSETDWAAACVDFLAGDASMRKYDRLTMPDGHTAVLMDAPPEKGEDVRPFVHIDRYLLSCGLSAPRILAEDENRGFLVIEDLGNAIYAREIERDSSLERPLYEAATDALITLHGNPLPEGLKCYDPEVMTGLSALAYDWYQGGATGKPHAGEEEFLSLFQPLLEEHVHPLDAVILRDYHAENLLWMPERAGAARVGQLDFQDAMIGHRAYDLVSLLQDARRDVPEAIEDAMIERFVSASGLNPITFRRAYDLLGVQRNMRIIGVFARLCIGYGRPHYVDFLPRVWGYLVRNLARPGMESLSARILSDLPAPSPELMERLKDQCATRPLP